MKSSLKHKQARLKNISGHTVYSDERAEVFATYLETVQWAVRPATLTPDTLPEINAPLALECGPFAPCDTEIEEREGND